MDKIEEKHHILAALQENGYPKEFIQGTVKKHNRRKEQPREHPEEEPKQTKASTYFTSKESVSSLNEHLISITSKQHFTNRQPLEVYKAKDPTPKEARKNSVYQRNCKDWWEKQSDH